MARQSRLSFNTDAFQCLNSRVMSINVHNESFWLLLVMFVTVGTSSSMAAHNLMVTNDAKPGCPRQCGNLIVQYPFGIGPRCSFSHSFSLVCDKSYNPPKLFTEKLNSSSTRVRVFNISETQIFVSGMIANNCPPSNWIRGKFIPSKSVKFIPPMNSPFTLSNKANTFSMAGSCDFYASSSTPGNGAENITCHLSCYGKTDYEFLSKACSVRNGCCKKPTAKSLKKGFSLKVGYLNNPNMKSHTTCGYAFFGMGDSFGLRNVYDYSDPTFVNRTEDNVPMVVDWVIGNQTCNEARQNPSSYVCQQNSNCTDVATGGYRCSCTHGYEGNPYLSPGCTDKNECVEGISNPCHKKAECTNTCSCSQGYHGDGYKNESGCKSLSKFPLPVVLGLSLGLLFLLVTGSGINFSIRRRKLAKTREKFFKENGGLMLKEKLSSSNRGSHYNFFKLFTIKELKEATKNFSKDLIVGIGGNGTVYKGTLRNARLVAVKMSKSVDNTQIEQFINEMVILTQIHHRNVVKLLGCCLEAEIPILVYEFVANGSLLDHIQGESNWLTWNNRLRIATETATALGYLHSAASTPIIHRDIKSSNILLDQNYGAKISDFGISRLRPLDKTHMSTLVQGTIGYMDPEYFLSSQLTDKSDVYSFGVLVAELLTREKALSLDRRMEDRNLAKYFLSSFTEGRLLDIIDPQIVDEAPQEQLMSVAKIVKECLRIKGADRPMMKDVAVQLAGLQRQPIETSDDPSIDDNEIREAWHIRVTSTADFSFTIEGR